MGVVVQEEDKDGRDPLAKTDLSRDVKVTSTQEFLFRFLKKKSTMNLKFIRDFRKNFVKFLNQD